MCIRDRNLSNIKELYFTGDFRMSYFSSEYPGTGAAQYIVFINIQNLNKESEDYGKLMHFGVQIFDSRYEVVPPY